MRNDSSGNDPKTIWQGQSREISTVTLERMIRRRAQELHAKTLRERLGSLAGPVCTIAFSAWGIAEGYNPVQLVVFAIAIAWSLAGVYVLNRGMRQATLAGDAALATGLEFCRREIEWRIYIHRRILQWCIAPIMLAIGAFFVPVMRSAVRENAKAIPFFALLALWIIAFFVIRVRGWRTLQQEIDELNDIELENRR
jgi:pimeloyl-ACP methyl ester carboxylesterase